MATLISPVYLSADTIHGIRYCEESDIVPEREYHINHFTELLEGMKIGEEIFVTIYAQEDLQDIINCYGIN